MSQTIQFYQILEMIDNLSCDEQDDLISIIRHRQIEKKTRRNRQEYPSSASRIPTRESLSGKH